MIRGNIVILVLALLAISPACSLIPSPLLPKEQASPPESFYTISGTLHPAREITLPGNTRVLVLWTVISEDSGYGYIFGEGTIDFVNYSFIVNFDGPPPTEAMNRLGDLSLGYGRVILTANQKWDGILGEEDFSRDEILGIVASDIIFYIDGSVDAVPNADWMKEFSQGYGIGREVKISSGSDRFEPVSPNSLQMIIDDLENIDIANWW